MFKELDPGDTVVLQRKGTYTEHQLYSFNGRLFAKVGNGYVQLHADGSVSNGGRMVTMAYDGDLWRDTFGRMLVQHKEGARQVTLQQKDSEVTALEYRAPNQLQSDNGDTNV